MPRKYHALKVPKVRQDWSKWNLYNLSRIKTPNASKLSFFQQKWAAKSLARAYHNPYVREGQWTRMFDRRLPAVVPMNFQYLARNDGSEQASGRGMGLEEEDAQEMERSEPGRRKLGMGMAKKSTPYMHMAFYPLERRLDTAIFRAMFASSSKQARQFVTHGWVKVNGKKMTYPGYLLNPGDMFSVEPDRVLFATGVQKPVQQKRGAKKAAAEGEEAGEGQEEANEESTEEPSKQAEVKGSDSKEAESESAPNEADAVPGPDEALKALKKLRNRASHIMEGSKAELTGRRRQELRSISKTVRATMTRFGRRDSKDPEGQSVEELTALLNDIVSKIPKEHLPATEKTSKSEDGSAPKSSNPQAQDPEHEDEYKAAKDAQLLHQALQRARENPYDPSKPYRTPWMPRSYMSAFAFIPRYLEVNQNICSAVYLRHPVARPGIAEVPTPLSAETMGLAFNWYLRRR